MKTKIAKVPKEWHENKAKMAKELGITTTKAIKLSDNIFAEVIKRKGKKRDKLEIFI